MTIAETLKKLIEAHGGTDTGGLRIDELVAKLAALDAEGGGGGGSDPIYVPVEITEDEEHPGEYNGSTTSDFGVVFAAALAKKPIYAFAAFGLTIKSYVPLTAYDVEDGEEKLIFSINQIVGETPTLVTLIWGNDGTQHGSVRPIFTPLTPAT